MVTWSVNTLAWRFACVSFSGGPYCVPSCIHTFWRLQLRATALVSLTHLSLLALGFVGIPLALLLSLGLWCVCFVAVVRSPVVCGSLLWFTCGCPSYHTSFCAVGVRRTTHMHMSKHIAVQSATR